MNSVPYSYCKAWSKSQCRPMGHLTTEEAKRYHLEGGSYTVLGNEENPVTIITVNSVPKFVGITTLGNLKRERYSLGFSSGANEAPFALVQAFAYRYSGDSFDWSEKITVYIKSDGAVHRELRKLEPLSVDQTELKVSTDPLLLPFPEFGVYSEIERYENPEVMRLLEWDS